MFAPPENRTSIFHRRRAAAFALLLSLTGLVANARADHYYDSWQQEYDSASALPQRPTAITMDGRGNVIVTGTAQAANSQNQFYTAKYDARTGRKLWEMLANAEGGSYLPKSVVADSVGDIIVTGTRTLNGDADYYTVKYHGLDGTPVWTQSVDGGQGGDEDDSIKVLVDSHDDVIVTGQSHSTATKFDIVTYKFAKESGDPVGAPDVFSSGANLDDTPSAMVLDKDDNIIIAGTLTATGNRPLFYVRKLDTTLTLVWDLALDTGGSAGAKAVAVDSVGNVVATGQYHDATGTVGFFTAEFAAANGAPIWETLHPVLSTDASGGPTGVVIGPDGNPIVTGTLDTATGSAIRTIKYDKAGAAGDSLVLWDNADTGFQIFQTDSSPRAEAITADGSGNALILGEIVHSNAGNDNPGVPSSANGFYILKYDNFAGQLRYYIYWDDSAGFDNSGVGVAVDRTGGFAFTGSATKSDGMPEFDTRKFDLLQVENGKPFANGPTKLVNAPAVADDGTLVARATVPLNKKNLAAIFVQGPGGGTYKGLGVVAQQNDPAPNITGSKTPLFASFSDPLVAPDGTYAFAAKVSGVTKALTSTVWTNLSGTLTEALQVGAPVPGLPTAKVVTVMSLSLRNGELLALLKVSGPTAMNTVLLGLDAGGNGTVLLRTGQPITVNQEVTTIKTITALTPSPTSPGDGRWQGDGRVVAKATLGDKAHTVALISIATDGTPTALLSTGQGAPGGTTWKTFGLPAIGAQGTGYAVHGTLEREKDEVAAGNDTVLAYSPNGVSFSAFATEGSAPNDPALSAFLYTGFSDPLINDNADVAFFANFKGTGVKATNNRALFFGPPAGTLKKIARTGDFAVTADGAPDAVAYSSFVTAALPSGHAAGPIFLAKLKGKGVTAKNNLGLFAVGSDGVTRRILRTGDKLDEETVASFLMLKAVPTAFSAARSFNATGSVALSVTFTDHSQALVEMGIP